MTTSNIDVRKMPWDALPTTFFRYAYETFEEIFLTEFNLSVDKTRRSVLDYVMALRGNTNLYLADVEGLRQLWNELSDIDDLQDFILKVTMTLLFFLGTEDWERLSKNIASSLSLFGDHRRHMPSIVLSDDSFISSTLIFEDAIRIVEDNPWMVVIFLITIMEPSVIRKLGAIFGRKEDSINDNETKPSRGQHGSSTENPN